MLRSFVALGLLCSCISGRAHFDAARPDSHGPIGVMGDHTHRAGEVMLSYRFMFMEMEGLRDGGNRVSAGRVLDSFMVTPLDMTMEMHMVGAMYAPADWVTLMAMLPYTRQSMDHLTRAGGRFTTESEGVGDLKLSGIFPLLETESGRLMGSFGLSVPTGSIDEVDATPAAPGGAILPYPMQLGSGTWDLLPGLTWTTQREDWSWGAQARGTLRLGENDRDYTLSHRAEGSAWFARVLHETVSVSTRLRLLHEGDIDGADPALNPAMVPTADPDRRGFTRVEALVGLNIFGRQGPLAGHRLALEAGLPFYQHVDGPQLEIDFLVTLGWQKSW